MNKIDSKELGHYLPSFFYMKINTDESLNNLNEVSKESLATFVHEYIHFLQDIITTWGLRSAMHTVDLLKDANTVIVGSEEEEFKIPFVPQEGSVTAKNNDLVSVYYGDYLFEFEFDEIVKVEEKENGLVEGYEHVPYVEVEVRNSITGETDSFHFGAIALIESQAHIIESELFPNVSAPVFPYKTAEFICKHMYPELAEDRLNVLAISEIAVNTTNPAYIFVDFIKQLKERNFIPEESPYEIFDKALYSFEKGDKHLTIPELYKDISEKAEKSLCDYFTTETYALPKKWVSVTIERGRKLRLGEGFSLLDLAFNRQEGVKKIIDLVNDIGTPLMSNSQELHWALHPKTGSEQYAGLFKAINEIRNVLFMGFSSTSNCRPTA